MMAPAKRKPDSKALIVKHFDLSLEVSTAECGLLCSENSMDCDQIGFLSGGGREEQFVSVFIHENRNLVAT